MIEIIDEAGNIHGPFETREKALDYAQDRGLGEQSDGEDARGWCFRMTRTASESKFPWGRAPDSPGS